MAQKLVEVISDTCIRCGGASGPEVIPGDTVKLYLDQDANADFPEWVEGIVITVAPQTEASTSPRYYTIQYESEDLDESANLLRDCDILSVICEGCCAIINDYLDLLAGINLPHVSLSYEWDAEGAIILSAEAYSTQISGQPGEPVTIESYVFTDPSDVVIPENLLAVDSRLITSADTGEADWPGGLYSVLVTDSEGLVNSASVWVAPKPRFRRVTVTLLATETEVVVPMVAEEEIISIMAASSVEGFFLFAPMDGDPTTIQASAAPVNNLDLKVLIHVP